MRTSIVQRALVAVLIAVGAVVAISLAPSRPVTAAPEPCADLAITAFSTSPATPIEGQNTNISITVKNNGTCSTNTSFVVQWKQTQFAQTGPSTTLGPLAPGASAVANLNYTFPNDGNFLSQVNVDTNNAIAETNEVNNLDIHSISVQEGTIDLTITDFVVVPSVNAQGHLALAFVSVTNNGNTASGPYQVAWNPTLSTPALTVAQGSLGAGASTVVGPIPFNYPDLGVFVSRARVDSTRLVRETNEFNNDATTTVTIVPDRPELEVSDITFSPATPVAGQNVNVAVTIENNGFETTGQNFTVSWQPHGLAAVLSQQVPALDEGDSTTVFFNYIYQLPGTFETTATVDSNNVINELLDNNNELTEEITVLPGLTDLTINNVTVTPSSPDQGENVTVTVNVSNLGNEAAGPFVVSWNPDANGLIVPSVGTLTQQVNSLAAFSSTNVVFNFTYPIAGPFHTIAEVDAFDVVNETNETNNLFIRDIVVDDDNLNLDVTAFSISPSNPDRFESVTASITIQNTGSLPVGWFRVTWLRSITDISGSNKWVPGLNPGQSVTVELSGLYFNAGTFTSRAIADSTGIIAETNEGDNTQDVSITVNPLDLP